MRHKIIRKEIKRIINELKPSRFKEYFFPLIGLALTITIFVLGINHIEKNRKTDTIINRFNDLKKDMFSENLQLVSLAIEDIINEYVLDGSITDYVYQQRVYELLGKRFVSLAPTIISDNIDIEWTAERKRLCGKILLYTCFIPQEIAASAPWEIQGKHLTGIHFRREYYSSNDSIGGNVDLVVGRMYFNRLLRPRLTKATITDCDFSDSELLFIDFSGADISKTSFKSANLISCNFDKSVITECVFNNANLGNSVFKPILMLGTDLRNMIIDSLRFYSIDKSFLRLSKKSKKSSKLYWDSKDKQVKEK